MNGKAPRMPRHEQQNACVGRCTASGTRSWHIHPPITHVVWFSAHREEEAAASGRQQRVVMARRKGRIVAGLKHTRKGVLLIRNGVLADSRVLEVVGGGCMCEQPCATGARAAWFVRPTAAICLCKYSAHIAAALKVLPYFMQIAASTGTYAIGITATQVAEGCELGIPGS